MEKYNLIKNELDEILNSDEIDYNGTYISAYDLKYMINNKLKYLFEIIAKEETVMKSINYQKRNIIQKILRLRRSIELDGIYLNTEIEENCQKIVFLFQHYSLSRNQEYIETEFYNSIIAFKSKDSNDEVKFISTEKDKQEESKKFVNQNILYITDILNAMEYYNEKYNITFSLNNINVQNQIFKFKNFNIIFDIGQSLNIYIMPTSQDLNNSFYKNWLTKENLTDYINRNIDELLKRIPINIYELNPFYRQIVNSSLEKTKQLKK